MPTQDFENLHLADLHARAAEAGIDGYRKLRRDQLVSKLESGEGSGRRSRRRRAPNVDLESDTTELDTVTEDKPERERPTRRRGGRGRGGRGRERLRANDGPRESKPEPSDREDGETHDVAGLLEVTRQRHGFLKLTGDHEGEPDVYVSAAQVRRCELRTGDEVAGPAREPRRGERHPALVHVDQVNGAEPVAEPDPADKRGGRPTGFEIRVAEAELEEDDAGKMAIGDGWFVLNARDGRWSVGEGRGRVLSFLGSVEGQQVAANLTALEPDEIMGMYHWESDQEGFFIVSGQALLIVEGEERPLRQGDFFHCPVNTSHIIIGAGEGCTVFTFGAQEHQAGDAWGGYSVDETAVAHKAGVEEETIDADVAYERFDDRKPQPYKPGTIPGDDA